MSANPWLKHHAARAANAPPAKVANDQPPPTQLVPTGPPPEGTTTPFSQQELDAIRQGHAVKVWSGVLNDWLIWVRDEERQQKAIAKGIDPWRLWTLAELTASQGMEPQDLKNPHTLKQRCNGTLNPGAPLARWRDALEPLQPAVQEVQP